MNRTSVYIEITLAGETIRFSVEMTEPYLHSAKGNGWADTNVRFRGKDYLVGGVYVNELQTRIVEYSGDNPRIMGVLYRAMGIHTSSELCNLVASTIETAESVLYLNGCSARLSVGTGITSRH